MIFATARGRTAMGPADLSRNATFAGTPTMRKLITLLLILAVTYSTAAACWSVSYDRVEDAAAWQTPPTPAAFLANQSAEDEEEAWHQSVKKVPFAGISLTHLVSKIAIAPCSLPCRSTALIRISPVTLRQFRI